MNNLSGTLYYLLGLGVLIAAIFFSGRKNKNEAVESLTAQLVTGQTALISAQSERIALLEKANKDLIEQNKIQQARIEYLEELLNIHGNPKVVQPGAVSHG